MDIVGVIRAVSNDYGDIFSDAWWHFLNKELTTAVSHKKENRKKILN